MLFSCSHCPSSFSQFSLGSQEDLEEPLPLTTFHAENEEHPLSETVTKKEARNGGHIIQEHTKEPDGEEASSRYSHSASCSRKA